MIKVSTTGMAVSLKTDLRFPESGQHGHGSRIIQIYWCLWILSETITVTSCAIPASSKSACKVFSFRVLRPARQKLPLKWLIDFLHLHGFYRWNPILVCHAAFRDKHAVFFRIKIKHPAAGRFRTRCL